MIPTLTILLTGVGAPGTPGTIECLRKGSQRDCVDLRIVGTDANADSPGQYQVDEFRPVPHATDDGYLSAITEASRGVDAILPQTTAEVEVLSRTKHRIAIRDTTGAKLVAAIGSSVRGANSKSAVMRTFGALGFLAPRFHVIRDILDLPVAAHELGWPDRPVVVKPDTGNGSRGVRVIAETSARAESYYTEKPGGAVTTMTRLLTELPDREADFKDLLVMEYLPGVEYTVDCFRGLRGGVVVPRIRKAMRGGITTHAVIDLRTDLQDASIAAARRMGLFGAFGFQFKADYSGQMKVLECNPRVQGTMVASLGAGLNAPWLAVREALSDDPTEAPDIPAVHDGGQYVRIWSGIHIPA